MTGDEYRDLAALWSTSAAERDRRDFDWAAKRTPNVARAAIWGELGVVVLLAGTILLAIIWNLGASTLLVGSLILILLGWSAWKRHHLGAVTLLIDTTDRLAFLRSLVVAKEAELNRSAIGLALILPATLLTMLLGFTLRGEQGSGELTAFLSAVLSTSRGLVSLGFLASAIMLLSLSHLRLSREVKRLRELRDDYANEAELDRFLSP